MSEKLFDARARACDTCSPWNGTSQRGVAAENQPVFARFDPLTTENHVKSHILSHFYVLRSWFQRAIG